ncbi:unnamed protein product [Orchesella dallaii]|uniref:SH2 domain-containing protein n=1 Tax=Orchesella dallaii TaxID=48710 RepID=A0ABP1PQR5_9HEXA
MQIPLTIAEILRDNMRKAKVGEKESSESVAGQKYCFLFVAELPTRIGKVKAWTTSLPLIVTTHSSHFEKAWAAIACDNAFPAPERKNFNVRDTVHWEQFSELLENLFTKWVGNGRVLEQSHLQSIKNKLKNHIIESNDNSNGKIPFNAIVGEGQRDDSESFWSYFYRAALIVTCPHLKDAWNKKLIDGFISYEEACQKLLSLPIKNRHGTFIVRFSDSKPGSISLVFITGNEVSWVVRRMDPIEFYKAKSLNHSYAYGPLLSQLNSQSEIYGQECFRCVYPNIPKEAAFEIFYNYARQMKKKDEESTKRKTGSPYVKIYTVLGDN